MKTSLWAWMIPARFRAQVAAAEESLTESREALETTEQRERQVNQIVARLETDRRKNNYGPTIARAIGRNA